VAALKQAGGQGWWTLLVTHSDGHIGATTFTTQGVPVAMVSDTLREGLFASSSLVELYGEYVQLSQDARAAWKPNGKQPPAQPCGHIAWPELAADGKWVCSQCKQPIGKD
jgi:hypothetical protein